MPLDPAFVADCLYLPEGTLIDEMVLVDVPGDRIIARMPTHAELPITRAQRAHPVRHPRHVSGGLMVHMTGIAAYAHAYYVLGLRHADGWVGYGAKINSARFRNLAPPGAPLLLECRATQKRIGTGSVFARYDFRFTQEGTVVYEADQSAMWTKIVDPESPGHAV